MVRVDKYMGCRKIIPEGVDEMDRVVRKQLLEMQGILRKMHIKLRELLERDNKEAVISLLPECQNGAVQLGTLIEDSEGVGFVTVGILEEYCEYLYMLHMDLMQGAEVNPEEIYLRMEGILDRVKNSILEDIKVKKEVVFLPYKASMWDSLESEWMAAEADPECDAYVIPIPYYDRKQDGSLGEMHYEAGEFPANVPVTDYNAYDFSGRRPDVVYIHNPYDEYNIVTTVHPFFYAKNLKKYTDQLVYIPYFVLAEIDPRNRGGVDGIAHFVLTPGVLHADKVILQSEEMRQIYIDVLVREQGEETRAGWEKKIFGNGSPKLDKVQRMSRDEVEIPKDWERILYRPDGSRKKVVLYNVGLGDLLKYEDKWIDKIKRTFEIFKEYREDVALLWRPHPLIQATIESMRPQLWEAYEALREQYKAEGWGIYDDTAELNRAIVLCDGYFGDASSLVQLCQSTEKPVMIQDVMV